MKLIEAQKIFASNISNLISYLLSCGYQITLGEAYRPDDLAIMYARRGRGTQSTQHANRMAIDLNIFTASGELLSSVEELEAIGKRWESMHTRNIWGGHYTKDPVEPDHFEMKENNGRR